MLVHVVADPEPFDPRKGINSSIESVAEDGSILFCTPFPVRALGHFTVKYVITDTNGKVTTIVSEELDPPVDKGIVTAVNADTDTFALSLYVTNVDTGGEARMGAYRINKTTRSFSVDIEDIYYAFYILDGVK